VNVTHGKNNSPAVKDTAMNIVPRCFTPNVFCLCATRNAIFERTKNSVSHRSTAVSNWIGAKEHSLRGRAFETKNARGHSSTEIFLQHNGPTALVNVRINL
jgi:hypothetical protein